MTFQKGNKYGQQSLDENRPTIKSSVGARLFQDQYDGIVAIARENDQSMGSVLRLIVDFYFEHHENPA